MGVSITLLIFSFIYLLSGFHEIRLRAKGKNWQTDGRDKEDEDVKKEIKQPDFGPATGQEMFLLLFSAALIAAAFALMPRVFGFLAIIAWLTLAIFLLIITLRREYLTKKLIEYHEKYNSWINFFGVKQWIKAQKNAEKVARKKSAYYHGEGGDNF